jgi:3-methylfumaryl-CoA hydratase
MSEFAEFVGRHRSRVSGLDPWAAAALQHSLELESPANATSLPPLWQWLYFLETPPRDQQGQDGHPRKGDFYPPIEQPRRMFVGGRSRYSRPLSLEVHGELTETILSCEKKTGGSGDMTLLTVAYDYRQNGELCIAEERDFMYLAARRGEEPETRADAEAEIPAHEWQRDLETDPVLLFKFSALTFNGHRIHYDRDYAREEESYPDLVVHGPMTALLLAELVRVNAGAPLREFMFRARAPLFVGDRLRLRGDRSGEKILLTAYRPDGKVAMTAEAHI